MKKTINELINTSITEEILEENLKCIKTTPNIDMSIFNGKSCPACGNQEGIKWINNTTPIDACFCPKCVSITVIIWGESDDTVKVFRDIKVKDGMTG